MKRFYSQLIQEHFSLYRQMLFIMGPRQVGKTTTCVELKKKYPRFFYFSWDKLADRQIIISGADVVAEIADLDGTQPGKALIVFDEIHKYHDWKNYLKGLYDSYPHQMHILVTGSARLDVYKKGGDSLMGRYFLYRFHPLTVAEILHAKSREEEIVPAKKISEKKFQTLWNYGGFPDPYLFANKRHFNRWKALRFQHLFYEEVRDLTRVRELSQIENLARIIQSQATKQSNINSLSKLIRASYPTVRDWIDKLTSLYFCFEVKPWSKNIARSLIKERKIYLWDWSVIEDKGARAENFIASHLLKAVHFWTDHGLGTYDLYYLRDKEKREVDFLVTKDEKPWFLVEAKYSNSQSISPALIYFQKATGAPHAFQVVIDLPYVDVDCFSEKRPVIVPARTFLSQLV